MSQPNAFLPSLHAPHVLRPQLYPGHKSFNSLSSHLSPTTPTSHSTVCLNLEAALGQARVYTTGGEAGPHTDAMKQATPTALRMATYSERRVERIKDMLMRSCTDDDLDKLQDFLKDRPPKTNDQCGLLNLPPEIRNRIYHYVAKDAHASVIGPHKCNYIRCKYNYGLRDSNGAKVRPGILGACRQLFIEFHGIFYGPHFLSVKIWRKETGWEDVKNSALIDAMVNEKHSLAYMEFCKTQKDTEEEVAYWRDHDEMVVGVRHVVLESGEVAESTFVFCLLSPWCDDFTDENRRWTNTWDCRTQGTARTVVRKDDRCALCIVSMGPERAASDRINYPRR